VRAARSATWIVLLSCLVASPAGAQTPRAEESWTPSNRATQAVTGKVTFLPSAITFQNGKSLALARGGQMLFRPEKKARKVTADLYRITAPEDLVLENGSPLCKGRMARYLIIWKSAKTANEVDPRSMAVFAGQKFDPGSADECGRYIYDAGAH
jgi:hypothetical protein